MTIFRYIVAYLLYLAGGCIIFESIEEAAESEQTTFKIYILNKKYSKPGFSFFVVVDEINLFRASRCLLIFSDRPFALLNMCSGELKQQIAAKKVIFLAHRPGVEFSIVKFMARH